MRDRSTLAVATDWRKSSHSGGANGGCVEVGTVPGLVGVRDTKLGAASPVLAFGAGEWAAFLAAVKADALGG